MSASHLSIPSGAQRSIEYRNKLPPNSLLTRSHKGVTSSRQQEKIARFPLTSLHIRLLGDRGVNISYYGDCASPSKLLTFFRLSAVETRMCLYACVQNGQGKTWPECRCVTRAQGPDSVTAASWLMWFILD